jgi:hypothetical protein
MMTINEEEKNSEELMEVMWKVIKYFPEGIWEGVKFLGNVNVEHDLEVNYKENVYGAFTFNNLLSRIRQMRNLLKKDDFLLALIFDPIIVTYHRLISDSLKRMVDLVRDHVSKDVGMISLRSMKKPRSELLHIV